MPFALIIFGVLFLVAGFKNRGPELFNLLKSDFTGGGNFFYWVIALVVIVAIGNVKTLRPVSNAFLAMVIIVIIVTNGKRGLFQNFIDQVRSGTQGQFNSDPVHRDNINSGINYSSPVIGGIFAQFLKQGNL